jgi:hypothetical protein
MRPANSSDHLARSGGPVKGAINQNVQVRLQALSLRCPQAVPHVGRGGSAASPWRASLQVLWCASDVNVHPLLLPGVELRARRLSASPRVASCQPRLGGTCLLSLHFAAGNRLGLRSATHLRLQWGKQRANNVAQWRGKICQTNGATVGGSVRRRRHSAAPPPVPRAMHGCLRCLHGASGTQSTPLAYPDE